MIIVRGRKTEILLIWVVLDLNISVLLVASAVCIHLTREHTDLIGRVASREVINNPWLCEFPGPTSARKGRKEMLISSWVISCRFECRYDGVWIHDPTPVRLLVTSGGMERDERWTRSMLVWLLMRGMVPPVHSHSSLWLY